MKLELSIGLEKIGEASGNLAASPQPRSLDINHTKYQQTKTCVKFAFSKLAVMRNCSRKGS
jgi:hypothetical protein